ncbi:HU family DNA-binding protein [Formicincola oecophyllae]|uniref:HU family DNA-binding protein n=1 Tax=Formicincola oecophyllae TaxID=2558361 RepID=A0A4Y6U717_9PROT|nr:HU family DNA-binding protein [Formicincola oecophyllae]QDH12964.1 HU family DNA-binding protein [Formicincola oecophyllae]
MEKPLNKQELIAAVAAETDLPKSKMTVVVEELLKTIEQALAKGQEVRLVGFGSFVTAHRKAAKGRNPRTGEEIDIPASTSVRFKPGKVLKDAVSKS